MHERVHEKWHILEKLNKCIEDYAINAIDQYSWFMCTFLLQCSSHTPCVGTLGEITYSIASPVMFPAVWLHFLFPSCMSTTLPSSQDRQTSRYQQSNI